MDVASLGSKLFRRIRAFLLPFSHAVNPVAVDPGRDIRRETKGVPDQKSSAHAKKSSINNNSYELVRSIVGPMSALGATSLSPSCVHTQRSAKYGP